MTDDSDHLDSDLDFDGSLARMSAAAMSALESITDEVEAIERKASKSVSPPKNSRAQQQTSSDSKSESYNVDQTLEDSATSIKHIDDIELSDNNDDDDDMSFDASLDGSIMGELTALRSVAQEIERELQDQDGHTMRTAIESLEKNADDQRNRVLTSDDHEIIRKVLLEEVKKYEPKNGWERFLKRYQLEGISEQDKTYALATICTFTWSIVFRLLYKVTFGELQ